MAAPPPPRRLMIEVHTWQRESHDLFDYEAKNAREGRIIVPNCTVKLLRIADDVRYCTEQEEFPETADHILSIKCDKDGCYSIFPADPARANARSYQRRLWMIVQKMPNARYVICENDIIKLGRCKMKVKQIVRTEEAAAEFKLDDSKPLICNSVPGDTSESQCRICLLEGENEHGPLVRPCNCKGSIACVHVECLRWWISGRLNMTGHPKGSFLFRRIKCEVCKEPFPTVIERDQERIHVVHIPECNRVPPFIVLESVVPGSIPQSYVASLSTSQETKLGRGHDADVRISDVSISRHHATISYVEGEFILQDNHSKFGTLVAKRNPLCIDIDGRAWVQAGRSILNVSLATESSIEEYTKGVGLPQPESSERNPSADGDGLSSNSQLRSSCGGGSDSASLKISPSQDPPCNSLSSTPPPSSSISPPPSPDKSTGVSSSVSSFLTPHAASRAPPPSRNTASSKEADVQPSSSSSSSFLCKSVNTIFFNDRTHKKRQEEGGKLSQSIATGLAEKLFVGYKSSPSIPAVGVAEDTLVEQPQSAESSLPPADAYALGFSSFSLRNSQEKRLMKKDCGVYCDDRLVFPQLFRLFPFDENFSAAVSSNVQRSSVLTPPFLKIPVSGRLLRGPSSSASFEAAEESEDEAPFLPENEADNESSDVCIASSKQSEQEQQKVMESLKEGISSHVRLISAESSDKAAAVRGIDFSDEEGGAAIMCGGLSTKKSLVFPPYPFAASLLQSNPLPASSSGGLSLKNAMFILQSAGKNAGNSADTQSDEGVASSEGVDGSFMKEREGNEASSASLLGGSVMDGKRGVFPPSLSEQFAVKSGSCEDSEDAEKEAACTQFAIDAALSSSCPKSGAFGSLEAAVPSTFHTNNSSFLEYGGPPLPLEAGDTELKTASFFHQKETPCVYKGDGDISTLKSSFLTPPPPPPPADDDDEKIPGKSAVFESKNLFSHQNYSCARGGSGSNTNADSMLAVTSRRKKSATTSTPVKEATSLGIQAPPVRSLDLTQNYLKTLSTRTITSAFCLNEANSGCDKSVGGSTDGAVFPLNNETVERSGERAAFPLVSASRGGVECTYNEFLSKTNRFSPFYAENNKKKQFSTFAPEGSGYELSRASQETLCEFTNEIEFSDADSSGVNGSGVLSTLLSSSHAVEKHEKCEKDVKGRDKGKQGKVQQVVMLQCANKATVCTIGPHQ